MSLERISISIPGPVEELKKYSYCENYGTIIQDLQNVHENYVTVEGTVEHLV